MMHNHKHDVPCAYCDNMEAALAKEKECMERDGFYAHLIADATDCPLGFNAHTHGLLKTWRHRELQIVFPVSPKVAMALFWNCVDKIKLGKKFKNGSVVSDIAGNGYKVKFIKAKESGRDVLRMILPDKAGNLDVDNITGNFRHQYCDIFPCGDGHVFSVN
jgi:hypothetical protein